MKKCDTKIFEPEAAECPGGPAEKPPVPLTIQVVGCEGGRITCRSHVVTGPFQLITSGPELPPEWLARCLAISDDQEDAPCR